MPGWSGTGCGSAGSLIELLTRCVAPCRASNRRGRYNFRMARKPAPDTPDASPVADFEQSLDALEQLVEQMERGDMSLEESLSAYERGVGLYRRCQTALEQAELRVRLLSDPQEPASAEPFAAPDA